MDIATTGKFFIYSYMNSCRFLLWRDQTSPDIFPNRAKTYMFIIPDQICILKTKIARLEQLHSCVNARTHEFSALGRPHSFDGIFILMCVSLRFLPFQFSLKRYNDSTLMEFLFLQLTFKRENRLSVISFENMTLSRFREKIILHVIG